MAIKITWRSFINTSFQTPSHTKQIWLWLVDSWAWNLNLILHWHRQGMVRTPAPVSQGSIVCRRRNEWIIESYWKATRTYTYIRLNTEISGFLQLWTHSCLEFTESEAGIWKYTSSLILPPGLFMIPLLWLPEQEVLGDIRITKHIH